MNQPLITNRCLIHGCYRNEVSTTSTRNEFFYGHVEKKSTENVIEVLKTIGFKMPFDISFNILGRRTILNIFTDLCREPYASKIIRGVESIDRFCCYRCDLIFDEVMAKIHSDITRHPIKKMEVKQ